MTKILVVDDERSIRNTLKEIFEFEKYEVEVAATAMDALDLLKIKSFDLIFTDIKMPQMDGIDFLTTLKPMCDTPVVMISGHGNIETAVECIKKGAYDYIEKPLDLNRLLLVVRNAVDKKKLAEEKNKLKKETLKLKQQISKRYTMIGHSPEMLKIRHLIDVIAQTSARVLITGANGTGKEVVARQIVAKSQRADQPFVEVNCAAIPSELIESELFGHEKGAFTSAIRQRTGKFVQANGGTLFLDEIGDMSLATQAKVLRCLQENNITPVGSDKSIAVDVRIIAATNKNLRKEIEAGRFREDLFHRLNVIPLHVPSLHDREDDIPELITHFITILSQEQGRSPKSIEPSAVLKLQGMPWRGNVRELRNVIERLLILSGETITRADVEQYV